MSLGITGGASSSASLGAGDAGTTNGATAVRTGVGLSAPCPDAKADKGLTSNEAESGAARLFPVKGLNGLTPVMALTMGVVDELAAWASWMSGSTAWARMVGVVLSCNVLALPSAAINLVVAAFAVLVLAGSKVLTAVCPVWDCTVTFKPFCGTGN